MTVCVCERERVSERDTGCVCVCDGERTSMSVRVLPICTLVKSSVCVAGQIVQWLVKSLTACRLVKSLDRLSVTAGQII